MTQPITQHAALTAIMSAGGVIIMGHDAQGFYSAEMEAAQRELIASGLARLSAELTYLDEEQVKITRAGVLAFRANNAPTTDAPQTDDLPAAMTDDEKADILMQVGSIELAQTTDERKVETQALIDLINTMLARRGGDVKDAPEKTVTCRVTGRTFKRGDHVTHVMMDYKGTAAIESIEDDEHAYITWDGVGLFLMEIAYLDHAKKTEV